jgi:hypothetical protein
MKGWTEARPGIGRKVRVGIAAALAILLVGSVALRVRPLARTASLWNFGLSHSAAECLRDRCNPYDTQALNREAALRGDRKGEMGPDSVGSPPSALVVVMPLAWVRWPAAGWIYDGVGAVSVMAACTLLILLLWREGSAAGAVLLLGAFAGRPFVQAMLAGNHGLLCVGCTAAACLLLLDPARGRQSGWVAAALLGVALAVKPQVAVGASVFLVVKAETRGWAAKAWALFLALLALGCAAYAWRLGSFEFLRSMAQGIELARSEGYMLSPAPSNPVAQSFLQLQASLLEVRGCTLWAANTMTALVVGLLVVAGLWIGLGRGGVRTRPRTLLALAVVVSLLPVYHRQYDRMLVLLLVPAAAEMGRAGRLLGWMFTGLGLAWMLWDVVGDRAARGENRWALSPVLELALCAVMLLSLWPGARSFRSMRDGEASATEGPADHATAADTVS